MAKPRHNRRDRARSAAGSAGLLALARARGGAAGIEFALAGPLFLLLLFAILEMGLDQLTQSVLDDATRNAARQIQLGYATTAGSVSALVCAELALLAPDCAGGVAVYAASGGAFAALPLAKAAPGGGLSLATFAPGAALSDVVLQVGYTRSFVLPFFGGLIGGSGTNTLVSTIAFQNEP